MEAGGMVKAEFWHEEPGYYQGALEVQP